MVMAVTWMHIFLAGMAGLGLGIGLVVGTVIMRAARGRNDELRPPDHRH